MHRMISLAVALLAAGANTAGAATYYKYSVGNIQVTDLGTLGGASSDAWGINDLGDVVGYAFNANGTKLPFIHLDGQMLSIYDGASPPLIYGIAFGINNSRVVVGHIADPNTFLDRPFYYYPGIWLQPSPSNPSFPLGLTWDATAQAINNSGRVVGWATRAVQANDPPVPNTQGACYDELPVYWQNTGSYPAALFCPTDLDDDGQAEGPIRALDINDSGNVVGIDGKTSTHSMYLFKNGVRYSVPAPAGLPTVDAYGLPIRGRASGINNKNWVVGAFPVYDQQGYEKNRAFFWDGVASQSQNLGLLPGGAYSSAEKVNESKMVIGNGSRAYGNVLVGAGFIWHPDFGMHQLPSKWYTGSLTSLRPTTCVARAINELQSGRVQAAGHCTIGTNMHAVRWDITINATPITIPITP